jgi:carboxyl-terminal processing protease
MKKTDSGRIVFGGDGITPDEKYEAPKATRMQAELVGGLVFFFYAPEYFATHDVHLAKDWQPDDTVLEDFKAFMVKRHVDFTAADFERERSWIRDRLREELFITAFSKEDSDRLAFLNDPEVHKAVESLPASKALLEKAHDVVARQAGKSPVPADAQ